MTDTEQPSARIVVEDYGDMIAKLRDMKLVFYRCLGSYQGEYLCVLLDEPELYGDRTGRRLFVYIDGYGSCSGCDWFESTAESKYENGEYISTVDFKEANEYVSQMKPSYILPARSFSAEELLTMFKPDSYGFEFTAAEAKEVAEAIAKAVQIVGLVEQVTEPLPKAA